MKKIKRERLKKVLEPAKIRSETKPNISEINIKSELLDQLIKSIGNFKTFNCKNSYIS